MPTARPDRLYMLAFDHRSSLTKGLLGVDGLLAGTDLEWAHDAKRLVLAALLRAIDGGVPRESAAILVDEELGARAATDANEHRITLAMPVERSGGKELTFEYGDAFGEHLQRFRPAFAKALLRRNPENDRELQAREDARLRELGAWTRLHDMGFLLEIVVPGRPAQLEAVGGSTDRYDAEIRPGLMLQVIEGLQQARVEPDIWKVEGVDRREDCERIASLARRDGRDAVRCLVLGRGADMHKVLTWLEVAAAVDGFAGFAVGRTLWWDELDGYRKGRLDRQAAIRAIADNYRRAVDTYAAASSAGSHA